MLEVSSGLKVSALEPASAAVCPSSRKTAAPLINSDRLVALTEGLCQPQASSEKSAAAQTPAWKVATFD